MNNAKIKFVDSTDKAALYTIIFENDDLSEYEKFLSKFRYDAELKRDYQVILFAVRQILDNGVFERYFRPEGKMRDRVCALPVTKSKLRLYCIRLSDKILIVGNGGVKNGKTYQENPELNGYVVDLQKFDKLIDNELKNGSISIEETAIKGIENKGFKL